MVMMWDISIDLMYFNWLLDICKEGVLLWGTPVLFTSIMPFKRSLTNILYMLFIIMILDTVILLGKKYKKV